MHRRHGRRVREQRQRLVDDPQQEGDLHEPLRQHILLEPVQDVLGDEVREEQLLNLDTKLKLSIK